MEEESNSDEGEEQNHNAGENPDDKKLLELSEQHSEKISSSTQKKKQK